jgi:hypothetical protein
MYANRVSFSEQLENTNVATGSCDSEVLHPAIIKTGDQSIDLLINQEAETDLLKRREFFTAKTWQKETGKKTLSG